jgi:hypothetical protein
MRLLSALCTALAIGCGGAAPPPAAADGASSEAGASPQTASLSSLQKKLQGTWEIVRYQSDRPIPQEAMPLMGELFDNLRVKIDGGKATYLAGKTTESHEYSLEEEDASGFKLVAKGGMFDGARCKLVGEDEWEVTDRGETWPGVSVLKRLK